MNKQIKLLRMITLAIGLTGLISSISCEQQSDPTPPTACFTTSGDYFEVNETIVFDNCSDDAKNYAWTFGDGSTSSEIEPTHSYSEPNEYIVTLRALNRELYDEDTKIIYITASNNQVEACFTASATSVEPEQTVSFTNCSANAESYSWSFGDGNSSTETNPSHKYYSAGQYTVKLTATSNENSDTYQMQINVLGSATNPEACFTFSPTTVEANQSVSFSNCSSNADSYYWTFGDGNNSTATSPSHTFAEAGTYTVSLTANSGGNSDTETKQIVVSQASSGTASVEFYVNMRIEYLWGRFDPDNDYVDIAGTFNNWGDGTQFKLIYTDVDYYWGIILEGFTVDETIEFKYRINGNWETAEFPGGNNRSYTVKEGENIIMVDYNDINQVTVDQYDYYGVPINSFSDYFMADFESENHGFHIGSGEDYSAEVINGHYVCSYATEGYVKWFSTSYDGPNENSNYEIEYYMKISEYTETNGSGVIWGMNESWDHYYCKISPYGSIWAGYYESSLWGNWQEEWITGGNESPSYNKVTIRKLASNYYVFRNEKFLFEHSADAFFGNKFGVMVNGTQKAEFDYINIKNIDLNFGKKAALSSPIFSSGTSAAKIMSPQE